MNRIDNRTCLVTGASSGIGKETVRGLVELGAHVAMVCRDRKRGEAAIREIVARTGVDRSHLVLMIADLSSQKEIRNLAREFDDRYDKLDVLVNNAGLVVGKREETVDGIEWTFAVNHLAPFLLTHLLLPRLRKGTRSRIVTVSSEAHRYGRIDPDDLQTRKWFMGFRVYCNTKLANVLFTRELARRLMESGSDITANSLHPGVVRTNFGKSGSPIIRSFMILGHPIMIGAKRGALASLYLASSPEVRKITGKYFRRRKEVRSSRSSCDDQLAWQLWEKSEELTGIVDYFD